MNLKSTLSIVLLIPFWSGCTPTTSSTLPHKETSQTVEFSNEKIPYSGDLEKLLEMSEEDMKVALANDYPNFDPLLIMETGDRTAFLENYGGHVTEQDVDDFVRRQYTMNDLMNETYFLPKEKTDWDWDGDQSCEEFLIEHVQKWPAPFSQNNDAFFEKTAGKNTLEISSLILPAEEGSDDRIKLTCYERFEDMGGTLEQTTQTVLYYNDQGELSDMLTTATDAPRFTDGEIFRRVHLEYNPQGDLQGKTAWGARFMANQRAVPAISYYYEETSF